MTTRGWFLGGATVLAIAAAAGAPSARQLGSRPAEDWIARLERPDRVAGLKIDYIIASLGLEPGATIADIGAGPGVLSLPLAKAVAPRGKVYAVEIDQAFLDRITQKTAEAKIPNVVPVLGEFSDPKLPARDVDVALFHDVLHHIKDRAAYLKATAGYVKPGGRIAIIELPPDGSHKAEPELIVTKDQAKQWLADAGFKPVQELDGLDGKWFIVYGRS
ncbi:MAG TPA: class I SAM-dependent methyltransferase [Vicinamibacterales bacterium]